MKKIRVLIISALLALTAVLFVACGAPALPSPELKLTNKTISWEAIDNARGYTVEINGETHDVRRTTYSFDNLSLEIGDYIIRVKARGNGVEFSDSAWAEIKYTQGFESGLVYTLINDGKEYAVSSVGKAKGDVVIEDEYNDLPITTISRLAFNNSLSVTSVVLGKNIKTIEDRAFYNCSKVTDIQLQEGVEYIGSEAFQGCNLLTTFKIPDSVKYLGERSFGYCRGLTDIDLGEGVIVIGNQSFFTCSSLKSITLPESLLYIGDSAFANCSLLESAKFECSVLTVGKSLFDSCITLADVDFGTCVFNISNSMFNDCAALERIVIPNTVSSISDYAFKNCSKLKDISIGDNVSSIGYNAFYNTVPYNDEQGFVVLIDKWIVATKTYDQYVDGEKTVVSIGDTEWNEKYKDRDDIVGIADYAFYLNSDLVTLTLPQSLKYLGTGAFSTSAKLNGVVIGGNVKEIGTNAFYNCKSLRNVRISSGVEVIGLRAFAYCSNLAINNVTIPDSVVRIGTQAFYRTGTWLSQVDIGVGVMYSGDGKWFLGCNPEMTGTVEVENGTTAIADYAFSSCSALQGVVLPETVNSIGEGAFYGCEGKYMGEMTMFPMFSVNIPFGITEIKPYTFYYCAVTSLSIPNSVTTIGRSAFSGATSLMELELPDTVTSIGEYAFWGCSMLMSVKLSNGITQIPDYAFSGCSRLASIDIPDGVTSIGNYAFFRCESLSAVKFGTQLLTIGERAFYMCALQSLDLSPLVTEIGDYAFYKNFALTSVNVGNRLQSIGEYAFYGCINIQNVVLPDSVTTIGDSAFRYCMSLSSISLGRYVTEIGTYAFYGCGYSEKVNNGGEIYHGLTIYSEASSEPSGWRQRWNSTFRPVVYGCTMSADLDGNRYVVSVLKSENSIENYNAYGGITAPSRKGYTFEGWATSPSGEVVYAANEIYNVPDGTTLYSVWKEIQP